jgi:YjbE family integral membrane protein
MLDAEFLVRALGIVAIDLTVAGDNALVIALAVRRLPPRQQLLGRVWGTAGAVALRLAAIFVVTWLLHVPFLRLAGGALLLWIAIRLVRATGESEPHAPAATSLRDAVWTIVVADAAMSLDNVLAVAGAARGDMALALFGVALSLPIVVWGSGLVATLMDRYPWIVWVGGGILGYVGGEMIVDDAVVEPRLAAVPGLGQMVSIVVALAVTAVGWRAARRASPSNVTG